MNCRKKGEFEGIDKPVKLNTDSMIQKEEEEFQRFHNFESF